MKQVAIKFNSLSLPSDVNSFRAKFIVWALSDLTIEGSKKGTGKLTTLSWACYPTQQALKDTRSQEIIHKVVLHNLLDRRSSLMFVY